MSPPDADRSQMAGNYIIVACKGVWVVLAHLRRGSVEVREGAEVTVGMTVGRAGNSGNTSEPHLHVHAQRPGTPEAPLGGEPVPVRLDGRYLVRGDRFRPSR
jgi:murein DD-endopeptidase MepM/ murein hydrolase activator NlpD